MKIAEHPPAVLWEGHLRLAPPHAICWSLTVAAEEQGKRAFASWLHAVLLAI